MATSMHQDWENLSCETCYGEGYLELWAQSFGGPYQYDKPCDDCQGTGTMLDETPEERYRWRTIWLRGATERAIFNHAVKNGLPLPEPDEVLF